MSDYEIFRLIWWGLLLVLLMGFAVMDGFDLGVASILKVVAKTDEERRVVINTVGPVWEGNQVWLILGGGAVFAAWPYLYAVAFSGFYLAMFLVLCTLILRPVAFKFRSKMPDEKWRAVWDNCLMISGLVPALVFGVAFGNALMGVPFTFDETMRMTYEGGLLGLLNPFALLCGLINLSMIVMHGAVWLSLKTEGQVEARAQGVVKKAGIAVCVLFALAIVAVALGVDGYQITSEIVKDGPSNPMRKTVLQGAGLWLDNYINLPVLFMLPLLVFGGVAGTLQMVARKKPLWGFVFSGLTCAMLVLTTGVTLFPFLLPSSLNPDASLTVWDASSSKLTLMIMAGVAALFVPIILAYTSWVYHVLRGKVTAAYVSEKSDTVY